MKLSIIDELADDLTKFVKEATLEIASELARDMPVDTAEARSNVVVSAGVDSSLLRPPFYPFKKGSGPHKNERANLTQVVAAINAEVTKIKPWQNVYIVNNAPQAALIDEGYVRSKQTGSNFVNKAIYNGLRKAEIKMSKVFKVSVYD